MTEEVKTAIETFKNGGVVVFPTDTAFGIGCRIDRSESVLRVFNIRKRPAEKAVLALVSSIEMAQEYVEPIPERVKNLMEQYWPGGLTIILKCNTSKVPEVVRGGGDTLGMRVPDHKLMLDVTREVGVPIIAPSANFAGEKTPFTLQEVDPKLTELVDFVLPGECTLKKASTVIDCSKEEWNIVREGAVELDI